jgi:phosphatidylglycerophosphate synthase
MRDVEQTNLKRSDKGPQEPPTRSYGDFFNYFGQERWVHSWLAEKRTRVLSWMVEPFRRLGLEPDTISYTGIAFLAGVFLYFVRKPLVAVMFLAGHIICDGLDGVFARHARKASQSGAFTDLVCDQLGMLVVAMAAVFHHFVAPVLGAVYMVLYLIVVGFGVIINTMGLGTRITITSKYFLYVVYAIWAAWQINLFTPLMYFFSVIMAIEVVIGYIRLKAGIRKKYDSAIKFGQGGAYSSKLNYALNLVVPLAALASILIYGNLIPIKAMIDKPSLQVEWQDGGALVSTEEKAQILGLGVNGDAFLALLRDEAGFIEMRSVVPSRPDGGESFSVPHYLSPVISAFPVYNNVLLIADNTTRLLLGIDLKASFAARRAVIIFTVPMGYLHVTAMTESEWNAKTVWLAANYLYTRKTYVIDPDKALNKGSLLGGVVARYTNAGFPSGMTCVKGTVMELNKSPFAELIYAAPVSRLVRGPNLLDAQHVSFAPPEPGLFGPFHYGDDLVMVSPRGKLFRVSLTKILSRTPWSQSGPR